MVLTKTINIHDLPNRITVNYFGESLIPLSQVHQIEKKLEEQFKEHASKEIENEKNKIQVLQENLFQKIEKEFQLVLGEISSKIPFLSIEIIKKALGCICFDEKTIMTIINDAIKEISDDSGYIEVFLCEKDLELLENKDQNWQKKYSKISFLKDDSMQSGDCLIKTRFGIIDARLDKKLEKIQRELQTS